MKRTHFGWIFIIIVIIIAGVVIYQGQTQSSSLAVSVIALVLLLLFYKLTITVSDDFVKFSLGIGLINGKYKLKDIIRCQPLNYIPFGWGIRFRPGVTIYNVSGNKAVELEIKGKNRKIWLGSNAPQEIADYINAELNKN